MCSFSIHQTKGPLLCPQIIIVPTNYETLRSAWLDTHLAGFYQYKFFIYIVRLYELVLSKNSLHID